MLRCSLVGEGSFSCNASDQIWAGHSAMLGTT